jgi:23S rRNA (cytidine2498-2'-O)-methyltransferase
MQQRILNATQELIALDVVAQQSVFSSSDESVYVLDVILGETSEKMFVGLHKHDDTYRNKASGKSVKWRNHVRQPGGVPKVDLPAEAPSRAYLKIEEAIEWSMLQLNRGDTALEIGSAPGGACYSLLQRGLRVYGMDPTPPDRKHAPVVAQHPKFREIRGVLETIDYALLPEKVDWLLCDANISPEVALPHLISLLKLYMSSIRGIFFTVKLGEDIWSNKKEPLVNYIDSLQDRIVDKTTIVTCASTQLPSNRQELLLCGLSKLGMERFKACVR